ncbi:MAG: glycosyltransferase family 39 protein [Armatimonadota bacterium]|nr:glycosyltransferase family 39 protein [Armatimonadota bacterium]
MRRRGDWLLVAVLAIGLVLRLTGLRWGLSSAQHYHPYHPDEVLQAMATTAVDPLRGDFDPGSYNYGSLSFFIVRLAFEAGEMLAPIQTPVHPTPEDLLWRVLRRIELLGRLLSALLGTATLLLVYGIARRLAGRTAGLSAAVLLAITPMHVAHAHYFTVDVPATFWSTAALWASLRLLDAPRARTAALSGALAGLAAATKYNMALVLLAPLTALLWHALAGSRAARRSVPAEKLEPVTWRQLCRQVFLPGLACAGAAAAAFLAGCPGVLLNTPAFLRDFFYEVQHVRTEHGILFWDTPPAWIYHVVSSLRFGLGVPLLLLAGAGVVAAALRRRPVDLILAAWALPYYLLIGVAQVKFQRYTLPLVPLLAVWAGVLGAAWLAGTGWSRRRTLAAVGAVALVSWTAGATVAYDLLFVLPDPRDRAAQWIHAHVPPGATLAMASPPWFQHPPLQPWNGGTKTAAAFQGQRERWPYVFQAGGWTAQRLREEPPDCFVLSDLEIRDHLRLNRPETLPMRQLVAALDAGYDRFEFAPSSSWPGLFGPGYPPEDWLYPAPTLYVYLAK